ncbi:MAG: ATP-binding cassette domain-containing protein [Salinibacterium sp.]|nr:ATP-binding cassette domain-containing protein [Salinibacterium sp.]
MPLARAARPTRAAEVQAAVMLHAVGHRFSGAAAPLFRGISLALEPGHVYGVTGPSGSGKSTLLSILAGWTRPTEGRVTRDDTARTAWVFQNPHGVAGRTAVDHVVLPLLARGVRRAEAEPEARDLLDSFMLTQVADADFGSLSGGEAQRLMLARGIASRPQLLLVDEPTAQLDRSTAATVNETLGALSSPHIVVVIATHDPSTSDRCSDGIDLERYR